MSDAPAKYRVLIVDDHPIVRYGYRQALASHAHVEVCGEAASAADALRQMDSARPDLVVVDISLDEGNGIELLKQIRKRYPGVKTLVASVYEERTLAARALRAGASGYLCKRDALDHLLTAIRQVLAGKTYLSPCLPRRLVQDAASAPADAPDPIETLSDRELEVFQLIGQGLKPQQIAEKLRVSRKTVDTHRENIRAKLGCVDAAELSRLAFRFWQEKRSST